MKPRTSANWLLPALAALALTACAGARTHEGYMVEDQMVSAIEPGIDNKASVEAMLGRPSFVSQFDGDSWYYVSRELQQFAFRTPRPQDEDLLRIAFNESGTVTAVDRRKGLDQVVSIDPAGDTTPTIDGESGFFDDIFSGIGGAGAQRTAGSGDPTRPD